MKNRAFSLIEVIVAVAIIGILSGIVGLKLRSYIANSKDTRAVASLNSFRLAAQTYQIDNDKPLIEDSSKYDDDTEIKKALEKLEIYLDKNAKDVEKIDFKFNTLKTLQSKFRIIDGTFEKQK